MNKKTLFVAALTAAISVGLTILLVAPPGTSAQEDKDSRLSSKILRWDEAKITQNEWGEFREFFTGECAGVTDLIVAVAIVKPGEALHKAHRHAEEQFYVAMEGSGTWNLDGKELPLKKGDVFYAEPWKVHGCTNTSKEPLTFFIIRWNGKGVPVPPEPPSK